MKRFLFFIMAVSMFFAVSSVDSFAARMEWPGSGGWGPKGEFSRLYNTETVATLKGTVESVERVTPSKGMSPGVHLVVRTEAGAESVHLGPSWFIENQDVKIEPGDQVEIKGSKVTYQGESAVIAAEVIKGSEKLELRDDDGVPVWAGWRRRG